MRTALRRVVVHPIVPAGAAAAVALAVATIAPVLPLVALVLAWTLLGVTAGYSISGSV